jgi:predicted ester cyclase
MAPLVPVDRTTREARIISEAQNKLLARRSLEELVNTCAVDRVSEFFSPDFVAPPAEMSGLESVRQHILVYHHCYPDLRVAVDGQIAEGDIVVTWWTMRGTHLGEFGGVKPTGKVIVLEGVNVQKILNGRIIEQWGGANFVANLCRFERMRVMAALDCERRISSHEKLKSNKVCDKVCGEVPARGREPMALKGAF